MIEALLSPVHILSYGELSAQELKMIASFVSRKPDELTLAVVADNAPIPAKEELIGELGKIATVHRYKKYSRIRRRPISWRCSAIRPSRISM